MVTKWKQTVRDGNKEKQAKVQQQQHQPTKVKAEKPSGVGVASLNRNVKRISTESDAGNGPSTSQMAAQDRPRSGSISTAAISNQQQLGSRSNSLNSQKIVGLNKTNENSSGITSKPKTLAKAKAKVSRPRLTGLEGDTSPLVAKTAERSIGTTKNKSTTSVLKTTASSTSSVNESPLARIMAASDKFHAEQQPKRKSVEVVFSDNFMDSLSAVDAAKPKKPKIVRKKLNEREDLTKSDVQDSSAPIAENELTGTETSVTKKRVKFCDEFGRNLVDVRFFEVEEGERINVTKIGGMDKEAIKHLDSQREKQFLLDARRHGFGSSTQATSVGYSSSLMDPSLMPPGHGRIFGGQQPLGAPTSQLRVLENRYPWRLLSVECQTIINVEPGCRSDSKLIETQRQSQQLPAIVLPTALPVSDIDSNELKRQREEGLMQMPKIIPLDLVSEVLPLKQSEAEDGGVNFELSKIDLSPKKGDEAETEEMMVDGTEQRLEDYEVYENEGLLSPSPERPSICQILSSDEDSRDDNKDKIFISKNNTTDSQEDDNDGGIASPEPEQLTEFIDSGSSSIKEIPTEQLTNSRNFGNEDDKEDLDIRDQQSMKLQQTIIPLVPSSNSLTSTPSSLSSTNLQAFKKIPNLNSLLQKINTIVGPSTGTNLKTLTTSVGSIRNDETSEQKFETDKDLEIVKHEGDTREKTLQNKIISIPPPPAPLYPSHQLPIGHPTPGAIFQSSFLPQMINAPRMFSPQHSDFSIPPPPIPGVRFSLTAQQRLPLGQQQQLTSSNISSTIDLQKQDVCVVKPTEISSELVERQKRQISPGPPGLDEGGSPPPSLDQNQQQKSPSIIQIPQAIKQPFSSPSSNVLMANQRQQNISSPQLSLDEAKEIAGICQFYKRTGTCNFGERCKFAHDDEHITFGVQMAMRGVSIPNKSGFRSGRGGGVNGGRSIRDSSQLDSESGAVGSEKRTSRRNGGNETNARHLDYEISPVRGDGNENNSLKGNRDRRYGRNSPIRRRGYSRSRSRSRERYNRRRRSRSRSRNERRRARSSSSSSSSRSVSSRSRSSTPKRGRDRRSRSPVTRRREYSRQRYRRDYYRRRSPRRRSSSSSFYRRKRRSSSSSTSESPGRGTNNNDDTVRENKNSGGDTDTGTPVLVISDETVFEGEKNSNRSGSVVMENRE